MLLRALIPVSAGLVMLCTAVACAPTVADPDARSPEPILTNDVFVLDREQHLHCLSDCLDPTPDPDVTYRSVRGGGRFSCAMRTDDTIECWGPNGFGDLAPEGRFRDATARTAQACAVDLAGEVFCWGDRAELMQANAPVGPWDRIEATRNGYCVWSEDGTVRCFHPSDPGEPSYGYQTFHVNGDVGCGLVGDGEVDCFIGKSSFRATRYFVKALDIAGLYQCVLMQETSAHKEGSLLCSGDPPHPEGQFEALSLYGSHGCVVTKDEEVLCWGGDWDTPQSFGTFP